MLQKYRLHQGPKHISFIITKKSPPIELSLTYWEMLMYFKYKTTPSTHLLNHSKRAQRDFLETSTTTGKGIRVLFNSWRVFSKTNKVHWFQLTTNCSNLIFSFLCITIFLIEGEHLVATMINVWFLRAVPEQFLEILALGVMAAYSSPTPQGVNPIPAS